MEQDLRTCPGCGAPSPNHSPCPYCSWTPVLSEEPNADAIEFMRRPPAAELPDDLMESVGTPPATELPEDSMESVGTPPAVDLVDDSTESIEPSSAHFRELLKPDVSPEHLLDQVPEELRGVLAARLKAAEETDTPVFNEATAARLREQGFIVSEDAHGARLSATPGQAADFSPSEVVKLAADLDGGVQPQAKLPICSNCQAASPVGETQCQWCGQPFPDEQ